MFESNKANTKDIQQFNQQRLFEKFVFSGFVLFFYAFNYSCCFAYIVLFRVFVLNLKLAECIRNLFSFISFRPIIFIKKV